MCSDPEDLSNPMCDGSGDTRSGDHIIPGNHVGGSQTPIIPSDPISDSGETIPIDYEPPVLPPEDMPSEILRTSRDQLAGILYEASTFFQFLALLVDGPIGVVELLAAGFACGATVEFGCVPGAAEVMIDFIALYNLSPLNLTETILSGLSSGLTIAADKIDDGEYGEATHTAIATFLTGLAAPDPSVDAFIDLYALGYAIGYYNGIDTIMNGGSFRTTK
jgi:hypothetical protein